MKLRYPTILVVLLFLMTPGIGNSETVDMEHRLSVSADYDDNVFKSLDDPEDDFLFRLFYSFDMDYKPVNEHLLLLNYQLGLKKYIDIISEDAVINRGRLGYEYRGLKRTSLGASSDIKFRNIRSAEEDYNKLVLNAHLTHAFPKNFYLQFLSSYTRFDYRTYGYFDYWSHQHGLSLRKAFGYVFSLGFQYFFQRKLFPYRAFTNIGPEGTEGFLFLSSKKRIDNLHELTMRVQYNRWLVAKVSYTFQINDSNSYGDSYYNHRLMVALSKGIFQRTNLHLLGIFQFRDSSDPVLNPHSYDVEEDDENLNSVTFKISQGILDWLALELKYSRYWYEYSSWRFDFQKNLYSLGIGFKF